MADPTDPSDPRPRQPFPAAVPSPFDPGSRPSGAYGGSGRRAQEPPPPRPSPDPFSVALQALLPGLVAATTAYLNKNQAAVALYDCKKSIEVSVKVDFYPPTVNRESDPVEDDDEAPRAPSAPSAPSAPAASQAPAAVITPEPAPTPSLPGPYSDKG